MLLVDEKDQQLSCLKSSVGKKRERKPLFITIPMSDDSIVQGVLPNIASAKVDSPRIIEEGGPTVHSNSFL